MAEWEHTRTEAGIKGQEFVSQVEWTQGLREVE